MKEIVRAYDRVPPRILNPKTTFSGRASPSGMSVVASPPLSQNPYSVAARVLSPPLQIVQKFRIGGLLNKASTGPVAVRDDHARLVIAH